MVNVVRCHHLHLDVSATKCRRTTHSLTAVDSRRLVKVSASVVATAELATVVERRQVDYVTTANERASTEHLVVAVTASDDLHCIASADCAVWQSRRAPGTVELAELECH